jgi:P4 family phage/plasmid primase-like protien
MAANTATMASYDIFSKHPLSEFLRTHEAPSGTSPKDVTVCGMGHVKKRWMVPDEHYSEYLDKLNDYLFVTKGRPINLVEQPRPDKAKPILIDLDFKFDETVSLDHRFNKNHITNFVHKITEGLHTFFETERYDAVRFFVSLRPQAYEVTTAGKKTVKDGIHIQCPDMTLINDKQKVLRSWLIDQQAIPEAFENIGFNNTVEDIYDESMVRKQGWFFYGESKPSIPPYKLEMVLNYNPDTKEIIEEDISSYNSRRLLGLLSVRYDVEEDDNEVREEQKELFDKYLKARPPTSNQNPNPQPPHVHEEQQVITQTVANPYVNEEFDTGEVDLVKRLAIECLSVERAETYKTWMEVGWCLYNICGEEDTFDTWVEFSKKSPKSTGTDWNKYRRDWIRGFSRNTAGSKLTIKSLHYWAREDNPHKYKEIVEEDHIRYIQYRVSDDHFHIAKLLRKVFKGDYCASLEARRTEWFMFDANLHSWRRINQGMQLQAKLSTHVNSLIAQARERLKTKNFKEWQEDMERNPQQNQNEKKDMFTRWREGTADGDRFVTLLKMENNLYKQDYKVSIMKAAVEQFYEEDFQAKLDINPYLIACKNGVLDLRNEVKDSVTGKIKVQVVFRPGKPDDYISKVAGRDEPISDSIEYHPYDPDDPKHKELMDFMRKIFPDKDLCTYFIRLMASCLEGMNREQCYYTWIGCGGNGKSKITELMKFTLGEYCGSLQSTALTRKRPESGAANPDIVAIKNKRFIFLQEPDEREPLNTSRMKQFSGEDVVEARGLFEDQQKFRISGKLFMMCNKLPPVNSMDRGTWRRIRVIPFNSKFVDETDPDLKAGRPNVFLRDKELDGKLRSWREAWLSLLVHVYETEYLVRGLEPVPAIVINESNKYKESFDQYGRFKAERMVDFRDARLGLAEYGDESMDIKEVQRAYTTWVNTNKEILTGKRLSKQELQNRLEEDFGNLDNNMFKRCRVFDDEDEMSTFIASRREGV